MLWRVILEPHDSMVHGQPRTDIGIGIRQSIIAIEVRRTSIEVIARIATYIPKQTERRVSKATYPAHKGWIAMI